MAVAVVDGLQLIHIQQHNAERALRAARTVSVRIRSQRSVFGNSQARVTHCHGQRAHLIKQARLINQRATQNDCVAGNFRGLSAMKNGPSKMRREKSAARWQAVFSKATRKSE